MSQFAIGCRLLVALGIVGGIVYLMHESGGSKEQSAPASTQVPVSGYRGDKLRLRPIMYTPFTESKPGADQNTVSLKALLQALYTDPGAQRCIVHGAMVEAGNQSDAGVAAYFQVVVIRMLSNRSDFGGTTACGVLHKVTRRGKGKLVRQFSGITISEVKWPPRPSETLSRMQRLLHEYLTGALQPPPQVARAQYYLNPCFSDPSNVREFNTTLKYLGSVDDHEFYRDIDAGEQVVGQDIPAPVCEQKSTRSLVHRKHAAPKIAAISPAVSLVSYLTPAAPQPARPKKKRVAGQ